MDGASATKMVDTGLILHRVKPKIIKIGIHSFPVRRSALIKRNSGSLQRSSVARRGATAPPIGLKSMQNTPFLALLRPICPQKTKIAPPIVIGTKIRLRPGVIWT